MPSGPLGSQPGSGGPGRGDSGGGAAFVPTPREQTARQLLRWEWDVGLAPRSAQGQPLDVGEALAALADGDHRPVLVLRECESCRGTEDAFLSRELDNEHTILLGRWFHAVKLPEQVLQPDHALHGLFEGKSPPHLFVATADGRTRIDLDGQQSQARLWKAMTSVLRKSYRKDPEAAAKALRKLLDELDPLDRRLSELEEALLSARATHGEDSPQAREAKADLEACAAERKELLERGEVLDDIGLKQPPAGG